MTNTDTHPPKGFFHTLAVWLVDWRGPLFWITTILLVAGLYFAQFIRIDNSLEVWFLEDDPTLVGYREFKKIYGNDEIILALVDGGEKGMFTRETLNAVYQASKEIEADETNFKRVLSVGLAPYIGLRGENELIVEDLMTASAATDAEVETIRQRFLEDPFKRKVLTDLAQRHAVLLIEPVASDEMDARRPVLIEAVKKTLTRNGLPFQLAGMGVMYDELNQLSMRDGFVFTTVSYVVICLVIFLLFRSWLYLGMVVTVMIQGTLCFLAIYGMFHQNFNMVTVVLPTLMLILSISDVSYVYNNYCFNIDKVIADKREGLIAVFAECLSPCLFTSLTNFFGFISIVVSPMQVLRGFGYFAAFSTLAEYALSMVCSAFLLGLMTPKAGMTVRRPFADQVETWVRMMPRHYKTVMTLLALSAVFGFWGIAHLQVDTYSMGFLLENNPVRQQSDFVEKTYGNYLPLECRLLTGKPDGIKNVAFLQTLARVHDELEALPEVQKAASIVDVMRKLNEVMSDRPADAPTTPEPGQGEGSAPGPVPGSPATTPASPGTSAPAANTGTTDPATAGAAPPATPAPAFPLPAPGQASSTSSDSADFRHTAGPAAPALPPASAGPVMPATYAVPDTDDKIAQLLMLYESDPDNDLKSMTDSGYQEARLTVRVPMVSAASLKRLEEAVAGVLHRNFDPLGVQIVFGGYVPLYARLIGYITNSQVSSFGLALLFIFGAMAVLFRRFSAIWLGVIPNVYPIIMTMGMMGWLGIRLDIATVTIASIALGVAVDDTIHELFLFFEPSRRHLDPVESISECLIEAGPAVVSTSIIYALGFSALALASIKSVIYFGGLLALTLVFGMLVEITVMPALVCQFRGVLDRARQAPGSPAPAPSPTEEIQKGS
ncbi:MAG: MMPL family transporter [Candidatus Riflebacteria bacterium]|nr:MMPL family transporter [Candidatus Riflebacteria bacterium]